MILSSFWQVLIFAHDSLKKKKNSRVLIFMISANFREILPKYVPPKSPNLKWAINEMMKPYSIFIPEFPHVFV